MKKEYAIYHELVLNALKMKELESQNANGLRNFCL